jgi:glycosyltransferase involved in cell wall biosynthesis
MRKSVGIILDHPDLERGKGAGIGRFASLLVDALEDHKSLFDIAAIRRRRSPSASFPLREVNPKELPGLSRVISLWYLTLPMMLKGSDLDIIHNPFQMPTGFRFAQKYVFTVHDVIPFLDAGVHPSKTVLTQRALLPSTLAKADRILAVSENTRKDLLRLFRLPEERVEVIHTAISPTFRPLPTAETDQMLARLGISQPYFLFVGTLEPRKNVPSIVRALLTVRRAGVDARLVIVGKKGWGYEEVFTVIRSLNLASSVTYLGHLPENELIAAYNGAMATVYPSFYEGFGLPPAESMACGTPVITSNVSSLPEVVGDAGIQVDPTSIEDIAAEMLHLIRDASLREELRKAGLKRAQLFSVERLGESIAGLYQRL